MDVLVTGPDGLLGRRVVQLLGAGHHVLALTRRHDSPAIKNVSWLRHDLAEPVLPVLPSRIDAVVHLAQSPYFREFPERAREIYEVSVGSTLRLLHWARSSGVKTFIYASSGGIYGHGNRGFKEDDNVMSPAGPLSFYFATKQCAELLIENYAACFTVIILRPFFIYGPCQRRVMLVPRLVRSVVDETDVMLKGSEGMRLNPVHVDDAAHAVAAALALTRSHKINVAGPEVLTLRRMCDIIGSHVGKAPKYVIEDDVEVMNLVGDITRMSQLLVRPTTTFSQGVADLCKEIMSEESV
jgi:nucleoside-diphosphate-sugar epimerase